MATSLNQILDVKELCKKLGGSSNSNAIWDDNEIASQWGSSVYIVSKSSNGKRVPNNSEIRPVFNFKYGSSPLNAFNNNSTTAINVRDDNWDSSAAFSINDSTCYFYSNNNVVGAGYYMEQSPISGGGYNFYQTNSSGKVISSSIYYTHYFNWTNQIVTVNKNNTTAYATYLTNESSLSINAKRLFKIDGTQGSTDSNLIASIQASNSRVALSRDSINSTYPITFVQIKGTHYSTDFLHGLLVVPPWTISANDLNNISYLGEVNKSVSVSSNTGNFTLSKGNSSDTWYTINNNNTITIAGNTNPTSRSATVNVSESISGTYTYGGESIAYSSGVITTSFTINQLKAPDVNLYVVWFPSHDLSTLYLITANSSAELTTVTYSNKGNFQINAPEAIKVGSSSYPFVIRLGLTASNAPDAMNYVQYSCYATINKSLNTVLIRWIQETSGGRAAYHENGEIVYGAKTIASSSSNYAINSYPTISWNSTIPEGYNLSSSLEVK